MKLITYQLPGDAVDSARWAITVGLYYPNNTLDECEYIIRRHIDMTAEIITFRELSKKEFCDDAYSKVPILP